MGRSTFIFLSHSCHNPVLSIYVSILEMLEFFRLDDGDQREFKNATVAVVGQVGTKLVPRLLTALSGSMRRLYG